MSVFYNPETKKSRIWVPIFIVLIPVLLTLLFFQIGRMIAEKEGTPQEKTVEKDIFE